MHDFRSLIEQQLQALAIESPDFNDAMKLLFPNFHVFFVRLIDGGHLFPRARLELNLAGSIRDTALVAGLHELLTRVVIVDLFTPPQRERIRLESVALAARRLSHKEIAKRLSEPASSTAVGKALQLHEKMISLGLSNPWTIVHEPPADYTKLRKDKNKRYVFTPLEGYERPPV
jgi:site-specific DNA recombinase